VGEISEFDDPEIDDTEVSDEFDDTSSELLFGETTTVTIATIIAMINNMATTNINWRRDRFAVLF
jgi:hypothetical protein